MVRQGVRKWLLCASLCFAVLALAVTGALTQNNLYIFAMIAAICVIIGLASFNKIEEAHYPYLIWAIGLALLLQSTLISSGLIGSDIHTEYYFYFKALGGWNYNDPHPYNSAIGSTLLAPFLTNAFHIPGYWIFKLVFPLLFSSVPVLLYSVFKKEFGAKTAFLSSIFFVIVPTWSMELIGIPRQMLGEITLALCLFVIMVTKWRMRIKVPLLIVLGITGATLHYIMGPLIILYLGLGALFLLFFKRRVFPVKWLSLIVPVLVVCNALYYGAVCKGMPLTLMTTGSDVVINLVVNMLPKQFAFLKPDVIIPAYPYEEPPESTTGYPEGMAEEIDKGIVLAVTEPPAATSHLPGFISNTDPVITAAWGGDFTSVDTWGKTFRIFQYATQLCVLVGCIILIKDRRKYTAEYLSFCATAAFMLGACMFVPHLAALINATRFYHLSLFMLAPTFVIGGKAIFRNFKVLSICLIVPYFVFTSGLIFEMSQQSDISRVSLPYSVSLSNHRVDMVGVFTENDMKVRDWAVANNLVIDMYADTHSQLLLWETAYTYWRDLRAALLTGKFKTGRYIFLSERNNRDETVILRPETGGSSSGRRVAYTYAEIGLDKVITKSKIVYQLGDAFILKVR